ncbi:unnamed protein product, partial [Closterium sp. Yama58-4]
TRSTSCAASDEAQRQWDPQHAAPYNAPSASAAAAAAVRDGGSASGSGSGAGEGDTRSSHDEGSDAATAVLPPSHMFCRLESVVLQIDVETHEILATMQLQPIQEAEAAEEQARAARASAAASVSRVLYARTEQDRVSCKRLSTSDTSTHGGFSIPRKAAEACLPHLDMTQSVPSQRITATDVLGNQWLFRHVYRGTPKRHLLTTGWSALSATWGLAAGDRIVFLRNRHGALKVAVRRSEVAMAALQARRHAQRSSLDGMADPGAAHPAASPGLSDVASADAVLATAARSYNRRTAFSVTFHPWVSASTPFVIPLPDFTRGLHVKAALQPGSEVRLTLETDDLATRRLRGTVLSLHHSPSATWPSSPWRSVQIKWGDTDGAPAMEHSGSRESATTATPATAATAAATAGAGSASPSAPRPAFLRTLTAPGGFTAYAPASARQGGVKREQQQEEGGAVHLTLSLGLSASTASPPSDHSSPSLKRRRTTGLVLPVLRHACHSDGGTPRSSNSREVERTAMEERAASGERAAAAGAESMDGQTASPSKQPASPCKLSPSPSRAAHRRRIKLRVEGSPVMRTVDLSGIGSFQSLYATCAAMLQLPLQQPGQPSESATCPWQLTYTDGDGDTLLVGDGPWSIFLEHVQTLTLMKALV